MEVSRSTRISKFLARHLRHAPEQLGLTLEPGGWADVDALLAACRAHRFPISRRELDEVVATNEKQRFAFDGDGTRIRAVQGHTVPVDLGLEATVPPPTLFHGTGARTLPAILASGLRPMGRHHVHLSADARTARAVGRRHGPPVVLEVDAAAMHGAGWRFWRASNGVWLVEEVPVEFLSVTD